jgi:hypothetical protein
MNQDLVDYFMRETDKKFDLLIHEIKDVKRDIAKLIAFRLMLMGMSGFIAGIVTILIEVYLKQ